MDIVTVVTATLSSSTATRRATLNSRPFMSRATALVVALAILSPGSVAASAFAVTPPCQDLRFPVALAPSQPVVWQVTGRLCGATSRRIVQVLIAGATEGGLAYWDFPHPAYYESAPTTWGPFRDSHSYAKYLADAGYASLTLDRIGTGASDHPPAEQVTVDSNAFVLHQVVQALRTGSPSLPAFDTVITVGRSLGSVVAYVESNRHGDVDGIISQSFRQHVQPAFATFPATFMPAQLELRFASLPPGYITTRPGARAAFLFTNRADPQVVAHEEATKETVTDAEAAALAVTFQPGREPTRTVTVPVLSIVGEADRFFCGPGCPEAGQEAGFFDRAACFESHVIPHVGHNMNLEPTGRTDVFPVLLGWVKTNFNPPGVRCADHDR